ncbi:MAG: trypsin-like peptidase domain-containing protein [Treponema sp.]|nr:trypsin-like peptidase domain-containing protein [Treponema sp.]
MEMSLSEKLTYSTVLIRCKYADGTIGSGTGFIINLCQNDETRTCVPVIITNNHVVENSIETQFEFCLQDEEGNPIDNKSFSITYRDNAWIQHPDKAIDLRCLPVANVLRELEKRHVKVFYIPLEVSLIAKTEQLESLSAMEDVIMIGYPTGLSDKYNHKPIIRKGITATHLKKNYQGKKEFLVDIACFPGSSGSPIFILNEGTYHIGNDLYAGSRIVFVGVLYGGPQYSAAGDFVLMNLPNMPQPRSLTQIPMNLGVAIKAELILAFEEKFSNHKLENEEQFNG